MAVLLWELFIAAVFVLLAVGVLAYLLVDLLVAAIHQGVKKKFPGPISAHPSKRSQRQPREGLRVARVLFQKSICSSSVFKGAAQRMHRRKASGQAVVEFTLMFFFLPSFGYLRISDWLFIAANWRRMPPAKEPVWLLPQTPSTPGTYRARCSIEWIARF